MITDELNKKIRKLTGKLKEADELNIVLKARLTKREYKMLHFWAEEAPIEDIYSRLNLDSQEYEKFSVKFIKKLNQEKLKQELVE